MVGESGEIRCFGDLGNEYCEHHLRFEGEIINKYSHRSR